MIFEYFNLKKEKTSIELPVSKELFNKTIQEVKGLDLINMNYNWLFWDLRDYLFEKIIIDSFQTKVESFCRKIQESKFDFLTNVDSESLKVVQIYYHVYYWSEIFIASEPENSFHKNEMVEDRLELILEFDLKELRHLLIELLIVFNVDYKEFIEDESIETHELMVDELVENLLRKSWAKIKKETNSKIVGTLFEGTGLGSTIDIDTSEKIGDTEDEIIDFFNKKI
ncbi:hypothetical protein EV195_105149 [Tenacibaculum skagerrakense]|uniref:Uncharacterized protein n=1 Tax=Tenacibaculum skagerrakense TaxID=186571 RepID=A0A4R2NTD6_9FLAO|nr:hypothetical protein [Tenacibaculum skagerrakense]TCP24718.1 hypothetical protein EV195_105149 [Tenacibaculum skagerrakense]